MTRTEIDPLGRIEIHTERARRLFRIGEERFLPVLIRAVGLQRQASAEANRALSGRPPHLADAVAAAAAAIAQGNHDAEFPLRVTALNQHIAYDKAVRIGAQALAENINLMTAALALGCVTEAEFDHWVVPADMTRPGATPGD